MQKARQSDKRKTASQTKVNLFSVFQTVNVWLHLTSLVLWIGSIAFFLFVFGPAVRGLPPGEGIRVLNRGRRLLQALSWIAINFLFLTGVLNLALRHITAGLDLGGVYYSWLSLKLFLFLAMFFNHSLQALKYSPKIELLTGATAQDIDSWPEPLLSYWKKWFLLLKINATLAPVVLLLALGLTRN